MLYTKCILGPIDKTDGFRVSVMSRHTLNDGVTPDIRIRNTIFDIHLKSLAPSPELIGDYYKRNLPWVDFERRYLEEIRYKDKISLVKFIAVMALKVDITMMCIEDTADFCHRRILAEECQRYEPELKVTHH